MFPSFDLRRSFILSAFVALSAVVLVIPGVQAGGIHDSSVKRRHGLNRLDTLEKRQGGSRFTYFKTGLGACGGFNVDSDYVVAINTPQWDGGSHCGEKVTITIDGKTAVATVVDRCVECPSGALDFTSGLFTHFADLGKGTMYGSWHFGDAAPAPKPTTSKESPTPTQTPTQTPTPKSTTSTSKTRKSTTTTSTSSAAPTSTSEASSTAVATTSSAAAAAALPTSGTLEQAGFVIIEMARVITH